MKPGNKVLQVVDIVEFVIHLLQNGLSRFANVERLDNGDCVGEAGAVGLGDFLSIDEKTEAHCETDKTESFVSFADSHFMLKFAKSMQGGDNGDNEWVDFVEVPHKSELTPECPKPAAFGRPRKGCTAEFEHDFFMPDSPEHKKYMRDLAKVSGMMRDAYVVFVDAQRRSQKSKL